MKETLPPRTILERLFATKTAANAAALMRSRYGLTFLGIISFLESFLPLPILTDPFLVAAIMANRSKVVFLILVTTVTSVLGGFMAYLMAVLFRDILLALLSPELIAILTSFVTGESQDTFVLTIIGAVTPIPYTIIAYAVAMINGSPLIFVIGSVVGRLFRYGIVGWCTYQFGSLALEYAKRSIILTSVVIFAAAAVYVWLKM